MSSPEASAESTDGTEASAPEPKRARRKSPANPVVAAAAKRLLAFAAAHGGAQSVVVEYVTASATRVVIVGADGRWGDQVLPSPEIAQQVVAEAKLTVSDGWDRESIASVKTTAYEWDRMAGHRSSAT